MENVIRPTITITDAELLCAAIRKTVVHNTMQPEKFLTLELVTALQLYEAKLTELLMLAETRAKIRELKNNLPG